MGWQLMIFTPQGAMKDGINLDTAKPEECLSVIKLIFASGKPIAPQMERIPLADKERLFDYLNDEREFPQSRYTKRIEEIHEAIAIELKE